MLMTPHFTEAGAHRAFKQLAETHEFKAADLGIHPLILTQVNPLEYL